MRHLSQISVVVSALLACSAAQAIPPPWTIEERKAGAELVVIAEISGIESARVEGRGGVMNRRAALKPLQVLKGAHEGATAPVLFSEPVHRGGRIQPMPVGGLGRPKIRAGETALIFLSKRAAGGEYVVRGGRFGYIPLRTGSKEDIGATRKQLEMLSRFCGRIEDGEVRDGLRGYYEAALAFTEKEAARASGERAAPDVARAENAFAAALYAQLREKKGNLFFSPFSIHTALAMTWAGARGVTEAEMARTLRVPDDQERVHPAVAALVKELNKANSSKIEMAVANALWGQRGEPFLEEFTDTLRAAYSAAMHRVDFAGATEEARLTINGWVEKRTRERIRELIARGVLTPGTVLVLTNAIYFKGEWAVQFDKARTREAPFRVSADRSVKVRMMSLKDTFAYADGGGFQAVILPYAGDALSMVVLLPKKPGGLAELEQALTPRLLGKVIASARRREVLVELPRFKMTAKFRLEEALGAMGMPTVFKGGAANFSGMNGKRDLFISAVIHKAFVEVNEEGTEAAAATAVVMARGGMPAYPRFRADHPFLFLIRHNKTGAILFMGRCVNPTDAGE